MNKKKVVCFGEILWDNLKEGRRLGGAPLNVCYHLLKTGIDSHIITQIGNDENGKDILAELDMLRISARYCYISNDKPTSTVEVETDEKQQVFYEIVEDVAWDFIKVDERMEQLVTGADALVFGSLVARSSASRDTLFKLIKQSRYRVFDMNLRAPFYEKELIFLLMKQAHLLKLNNDELIIIMEWLEIKASGLQEQLLSVQLLFPNIHEIILTLGDQGSMYYSKQEHWRIKANKVIVKDTVGSGDSFLAAFLGNRLLGKPVKEALHQANLLSGFVASRQGACPEYTQDDLPLTETVFSK